jgi:hypothetical protein
MAVIYSKWAWIMYTNIFHSKALQNLPKWGFLVWKNTIWQPCFRAHWQEGKEKRSSGFFFLLRIDFFGYKSIGFVLLLSAKTAYKASR